MCLASRLAGAYLPNMSEVSTISITLNGEAKDVPAHTVSGLLECLSLPLTKIAVERNMAIVPRSAFATTPVEEGDRIEIVQFVGGG